MRRKWIAVCLFLILAATLFAAPAAVLGASVPVPEKSSNLGDNDYRTWSSPVRSYLYEEEGNLVRVEYLDGMILVERYNDSFVLLDSRKIPMDEGFSLWGGFYAGEEDNYVIIGQPNPTENDDVEVIRVIKYDKNWERLDQAGLFGANTVAPFDAGSLRCTEYNGMLYVRTSHTMYASDDVNVRAEPSTDGEIFSSFYQGDQVTVVGETPNWYIVDVDDYDSNGYVSKQYMSESEVAPKTDEERQQLIEQQLSNETSASDSTGDSAAASTDTSSVDLEYNVMTYADSFPVVATTGANMRSTPSQDGEIIQTIASGTTLTAVGYTDRWYKVEYDGTVGYVNQNLFSAE